MHSPKLQLLVVYTVVGALVGEEPPRGSTSNKIVIIIIIVMSQYETLECRPHYE